MTTNSSENNLTVEGITMSIAGKKVNILLHKLVIVDFNSINLRPQISISCWWKLRFMPINIRGINVLYMDWNMLLRKPLIIVHRRSQQNSKTTQTSISLHPSRPKQRETRLWLFSKLIYNSFNNYLLLSPQYFTNGKKTWPSCEDVSGCQIAEQNIQNLRRWA